MKARLGWLVAVVGAGAVALSAAAQGSTKLAVGPDAGGYLCPDGRQLYVKSCYDNSPDATCGIVLMHLPPQNGYQRENMETRAKLTPSVAACKVYPLEFRKDGTVGLVVPKSAAPVQTAKAPAAAPGAQDIPRRAPQTTGDTLDLTVPDGMAFGYTNVRSSLVRISTPGANNSVFYVDEASRRPTGQKDTVAIWLLQVWPEGNPSAASVGAVWTEMNANCKQKSYKLTVGLLLDREAKVLSFEAMNGGGSASKDVTAGTPFNIACKTFTPSKGLRFASAKAAIADAFAGAAPKTAAKPATPPAQPNAAAQAQLAFLEGERLSDEVGGDGNAVRLREEAALAAYAKATKLDPTLRAAWLRQGDIYSYDFDSLGAIPFYEKAMELDPTDVETADAICGHYVITRLSPAKGAAACERLLKLKPKDPTFVHSATARLRQQTGDNPKALVSALEWARLAPGESYAWTTLADIYVALRRNSDALAAIQKAVKLEPTAWSHLAQRGDIFRRLGKSTESIADYKAGIAIWPEGPELHHDLSVVLRTAGRKSEADAEQQLAIEYALSNGRNALKKPADGSPLSIGKIIAAKSFLEMLEKWDSSAAAKLVADIKAAEQ